MTTELVELAPCICGAVVDSDECPYPSGRAGDPGPGRQLYVVNCTNEGCGWQCLGYGADGARKAWNTRALASRAGVPDGFVLAPREPTDAMLASAGALVFREAGEVWGSRGSFAEELVIETQRKCYAAMLAAAPEPLAVGSALAPGCGDGVGS